MIESPTVLVLGAGASAPYGFPVGDTYKAAVLDKFTDSDVIWEQLGVSFDTREEVRRHFSATMESSIDIWLDSWQLGAKDNQDLVDEFIKIGKIAIAAVILRRESNGNLGFNSDPKLRQLGDWYRYIWPLIDAPLDYFGRNDLSIITFNYDRSFEYCLYNSLKAKGNPPDDEIAECLSQINIHHVYGSVAAPHYLKQESGLAFGGFQATSSITAALERVKLVNERVFSGEVMKQVGAYSWLEKAERIVFLGFGFHKENMEVLNIGKYAQDKSIWATAKNLDPRDLNDAMWWFKSPNVRKPRFGKPEQNILDYLKANPGCLG